MDAVQGRSVVGVIPRLVHRLWFGPRPMPDVYQEFGAGWVRLNPGWRVHDWGYEDLPVLRNQYLFGRCGVTWGGVAGGGKQATARQVQQADIAAYELVEQFGGVYVNCDLEPLEPLDGLLDVVAGRAFAVRSPHRRYLSNAVLGGPSGHGFWSAVVDFLPTMVAASPAKAMNKQTGPALLTEVAARVGVWPDRDSDEFVAVPDGMFGVAVHRWGHRTPDEVLWPGEVAQPVVEPVWVSKRWDSDE